MKKWIALFMMFIMILSISNGLAEETVVHNAFNDFEFSVVMDDGFSIIQEQLGNVFLIRFLSETNNDINYTLSIAYSEMYDGQSLADFSKEEYDLFVSLLALNYSNPIVISETTQEGTPLVSLNETAENVDFITLATVYDGYVLEMHIDYDDYAQLSDEEYAMGIQIFSDIKAL